MIFEKLFSHLDLGTLRVRNRIAFLAHRTNLAGKGRVSEPLIAYYRERAKGGCALIIVGEFSVHPNDRPYEKIIHLYEGTGFDKIKKLALAIHEESGHVFGQLTHRGFQSQGVISRLPLWGPEPASDVVHGEVCKGMEEDDIKEVTQAFIDAAVRLKEAGFDGLELDVGETSLLRQFLSPLSNHREDDYGGDLSNRLRLTLNILRGVKQVVGKNFPVGVRLCLDEVFWDALNLEESLLAAQQIEQEGLVDFFNTTIGTYYNLYLNQASMHHQIGLTLERVASLKETVTVPIFAGNRIHTPQLGEKILELGQADMIGLIRPLICDPQLPNKSRDGKMADIVYCVSDNQNCVGRTARIKPIGCIQNPWVGREIEKAYLKKSKKTVNSRVVVVGAGPAGLKAGFTAALCGHNVVIYEKEKEPGGQLRLARLGAGREEIWTVVENLTRQLERLDVPIFTESPLDTEAILSDAPDAVIIATGSYPNPRPVPGAYGPPTVLNVWQALQAPDTVGERVLLLDENGHHQATATAEFLADHGRKVDIMTSDPFVGMDLATIGDLYLTRQRLLQKGVRFFSDRVVLEIQNNVVMAADRFSEEVSSTQGYDTLIPVMGNIPDDSLYKQLKGRVPMIHRVGDCVAPRMIDMAILEGNRAALSI
jgi:mycofactocin system FadH/OYE family oxidoreductase 2